MVSRQLHELVSIAIPAYRRPAYLRESLDSVLGQGYASLEVLVGVDPDDEEVRQVAEAYAGRDRRIRVEDLPRLRLAPKLNALLRAAQGSVLGVFSDDDVMAPTFVERCVRLLNLNRPGFVYADFNRWYPESGKRVRAEPDGDGHCPKNLNGMLFARSALEAARQLQGDYFLPQLRVYADTVLLHQLRTLGYPGAHVHEPLVDYRIHEGQLTRRVTYPLILDHIAATRLCGEGGSITKDELFRLLRWMIANRTGLRLERVLGGAGPQ